MKLTKRQLSSNFHVDDTTIYLWEHNKVQPSLAQIPKIIEFLGRDPFKVEAKSLADKIKTYRQPQGLSQKKLADLLEIDQTTLAGWERSEHRPTERMRAKLKVFSDL